MQAHPQSSPAAWPTSFLASSADPLSDDETAASIAEGPGLAHDAGNLLGALGLYCDLLDVPGVLRPEHLHYARELRSLSQRSTALIGRLLAQEMGPRAAPSRLPSQCPARLLRELTPLLRSLAMPESDLHVTVPDRLPALPFVAESFERILVNLTRNAATALRRRHAGVPGEPAITISLGLGSGLGSGLGEVAGNAPGKLVLSIADTAGGMAPTMAAAFLKPRPLPAGVQRGLGQRIVHELLQATGGELCIAVVNGRSTTIRIEWPLDLDAAAPDSAAALPQGAFSC